MFTAFFRKKFFRLNIFLLLFFVAAAVVVKPAVASSTFKTSRTRLLDPCGQQMVVRGVNAGIAFPSDPTAKSLSEISLTGANTVRLTFRWRINKSNPQAVDVALQKAVENNMVAMPSIWDASGNWKQLSFAVDFWAQPEMVSVLRQYEDMLLLNIANEAGSSSVWHDDFRQQYSLAIKKLRKAGLHMPLVIDAADWGRDEAYIIQNARYLIRQDPDQNLLFSWHPWDENQPQERYKTAIDTINKKRIPLLIGEFSNVGAQGKGNIDYNYLMQYASENNIGWLWWWWSSGLTANHHAMTTDGLYGNWANVGEDVALTNPYGISATSKRTGYMENRSCSGQVGSDSIPLAPSKLTAIATQGAEVSLSWSDNSRSEKNFDIEVWDENKQNWRLVKVVEANKKSAVIGAGSEFVYSMNSASDPSLDYNTTYQVRVGAYVSRNAKAYSEPVTVTTNSNPSVCSNGTGLEGDYYSAKGGAWQGLYKVDPQINFDWGTGSPDPSDPLAPTDHFEIAWFGEIEPQFDGEYTFYTNSDDFARVWIDGYVVMENYQANAKGWMTGKVKLTAGVKYTILVEYREWDGAANMALYWANSKLKRELVPQCRLFVTSTD